MKKSSKPSEAAPEAEIPTAGATAQPAKPANPEPPDPFDPAALRLGADYAAGLGVKKVISTIPTRKPGKQEWFRVRPGDDWRIQTAVFEAEEGREIYLVDRALWTDLAGEIHPALLMVCVNRAGDLFLWRAKLPGEDGRSNTWTESALRIAAAAERQWVRMVANLHAGHYEHFEPATDLPDPEWPALALPEILRIAFRDRFVTTLDHPLLRQLRGQS